MSSSDFDVIVTGAGPVGLSHALFLSHLGYKVFICDKKSEPTQESRAVGINPRTLELFDTIGISSRLVSQGIKGKWLNFHAANKHILTTLQLSLAKHRYPFLLLLPQNETELLLIEALQKQNVNVCWNTELVDFKQQANHVTATLDQQSQRKALTAQYLVGADGAHSVVRKQLQLSFHGTALPDQWSMVDALVDWPADWAEADLFPLKDGGILFCVQIGEGRYRIISNKPNVSTHIPSDVNIKKILWQSDFQVHCRQVDKYQQGRVFVMGDAAHIHSPAGGRGMNLGIEDAYVLAHLIDQDDVKRYTSLRKPIGHKVIKLTNRMFKFASMKNVLGIALRNWMLKHVLSKPKIQQKLLKTILGVNYPTRM